MRIPQILSVWILLIFIASCSHTSVWAENSTLPSKTPGPSQVFEEGLASWYGGKFQGRLTASGEKFDTYNFTAAHKTLAFNSLVRVWSEATGKSVIVRINDRGPFVEGRIIDLSFAAAAEIGIAGLGVGKVRLEMIKQGDGLSLYQKRRAGLIEFQTGSFRDSENAEELLNSIRKTGMPCYIEESSSWFRVIVGPVGSVDRNSTISELEKLGITEYLVRKTSLD
jgi:rare lipoprotein A